MSLVTPLLLYLFAAILVVLGILVHRGNFDILRTYHSNQNYSKISYRKAVGKSMIFFGAVLAAVGTASIFVDSAAFVLILLPAIIVGMIPFFIVQIKYNGELF